MRSFLPPLAAAMAIFLLGLGILAWRQDRGLTGLRAALRQADDVARQQRERDAGRIRALTADLEDANRRLADLGLALQLAQEAADPRGEAVAELRRDPAYAEMRQRQTRRAVQERYGALFARLDLPPEKLNRLKELLVQLAGAPWTDPGAGAAAAPRTAAMIEQDVRALLGDEDYAAYQNYGYELTQVRPQVNRFATDAADAGLPLSTEQRDALSRAILAATRPLTAAGDPGGDGPADERLLTDAADVLTPAQLELFRTFRVQERASLEAWRKLARP